MTNTPRNTGRRAGTGTRRGPRRTPARVGPRSRRGRILAGVLAGVLVAAAPVGAQKPCDESSGTLGIRGLRCEGCTYSMSKEGITEARFRTEPQILAVWLGLPEGDRLRAGDRIIAVDGALITTREGSERLVDLQAGQAVAVRVRRGGRELELRMVAASACDLDRRLERAEAEVETLPPPEGRSVFELPPPPPAEAPPADAPLPARPAMPAMPPMPPMPAMPAMPPSGYLGFGITCGPCGVRDGVRFFDRNPPKVTGVVTGGPADRAGLQADDVILAVDGAAITSAEGGRRFSELESGDRVELTVRRGDTRQTVVLEVGERLVRRAPPPPKAIAGSGEWRVLDGAANLDGPVRLQDVTVRFDGRVDGVDVEVRGAPVTVTRDAASGELVIRTADTVIRVSRRGG